MPDIKLAQTKIDGYDVEMDDTGETGINCYITKRRPGQWRSYTASLAVLLDTGELESSDGYAHAVHQQTIRAIEKWAEANGY